MTTDADDETNQMETAAMWYIIQTNPNCENKAAGNLRRIGVRVYVPKRATVVRNRRLHTEAVQFRPLLVGYLFIRIPEAMLDGAGRVPFGNLRACEGVKDFLRVMDSRGEWVPMRIPEKPVVDFIRRQRHREFGRPELERNKRNRLSTMFKRGDHVLVAHGPFEAFFATVEHLRRNGEVEATVTIFGRETKVVFTDPVEELRPAERSRAA